MKTPLTSVILAAALPMFALAEMTAWFNPQIETYTTWPTNNAAAFGGEWSGVDNATLSDDGLVVDGDIAFVATEAKALADGDVVIKGRWTADSCESLPEIPQIAKCGICTLEDLNSTSNFYHVIAFDFSIGSNTWVNTGIESTTNDTFSAKISASSNGLEFVSVVYSFSGGRDVATDVFVGENASNVSHIMLSGSGTLSSLSATANHAYHPLRSINVNFTAGVSLGTSDFETLIGADGYAIPCAVWDNVIAANGTNDVHVYRNDSGEYDETSGVTAIVEKTRGYWSCNNLSGSDSLLHGYIDDIVGSMSPNVKVTGIPFEKFRAVIYYSTDSANARFGHLTVNGINLTSDNLNLGTEGGYVTRYGTSAWGNAGGSNSALPLAQGVNYLITPVLEGGELDVHTHNFREGSLFVRGTIAAIQIVETEEDVVRREVVFDIGDGAMHVGGGELVQTVVEGAAAVEPIVVATNGTFFSGWDMDFSCVTNDMLVRANYAADVPQTRYEGIVNSDMVNFDSVLWTAPKKFPDADGSYTQLFLSVLSPAILTITDHFEIGMLVLAGDCDITIRMLGDGAFYPGAINTEDYSGTLKFIVGECARLNYYLGQSSSATAPASGVDYLPFRYFDMEVESGGTVGFTYSATGYSNVMNLDFSRLTGDGLISLDNKYNGNANWVVFPASIFASSLSFHNDSDVVMNQAFTDQNPFTVHNLSGNGRFRCDWAQYVMRRLRTIQTRNSMFTGRFMSNTNGNGERECNLNVASDGETHDYENKRLILSGEGGIEESSSYWQFQDAKGTLTVERTGALEINYLWGGPADIYGAVGGCGGFSSNVVFETGAEFILSTNGHLTATGSIAFGDSLTVRTEEEPLGLLVLAVEDSVSVPDISNTDLILYVKGERSDLFRFMVMEDGLYVAPKEGVKSVRFDVGAHGHRAGGGNLLQFITEGSTIEAPAMRGDDGWVFVGWDVDIENMEDGDIATAQYRTLKADLHVDALSAPEAAVTGDKVTISWTLGNTGNSNWSGITFEQIRLVDVNDPSHVVFLASLADYLDIPRDGGSLVRSFEWTIPVKGVAGEWLVVVETAIGSTNEHGGDNTLTSTNTLTLTQRPLPDLSVKSIALDLDPAEYMPLDTVTVRYVVQNTGTGAANAPWRDRLYLCKNGTRVTLATLNETEDIAAGEEVERTIQCVIPELIALSGNVSFVVKADCDDSIVEAADDDAAEDVAWEATPNATLGKRIYLAFNSTSVYENSGSVRFYAKRSGETDKALVLSLSAAGATSDVTFPAEITIGAGSSTASGYVYPIDNNVVEGTRTVVFTLIPPVDAGFAAATSVLTIVDNEVPKLTMSFDKTSIKEGDGTILVTLTRELVTDEPLTVYLNGVSTSHCSYPASVVIPAGAASVTFEIDPVNNDAAEIAAALTLRASANGYTSATQSFTVEDDDVPSVTLAIYPEELSEGAGPNAAYAILSRVNEDNIGSAITVNLTPSLANQLIMQSSVTIPAYTMAVRFPIGTVDNGDDEPDRDITITGSIYIPSCGCSGQPSSGDVIEANIRIIDNDVPALSLAADPSTMKEGLEHAGNLILSHNSALTENLVVTLSYDTEGEIVIPESITIRAGETSVIIPVRTIDDGETDGGKLVSVYADDETGAFKSASTWIQVSDQNLPDLKVTGITLPASVHAGRQFEIEFETANIGFVNAPNEIEYAIHLIGGGRGSSATSSNKVGTGKITGGLGVNDSISTSFTITAPPDTGDYRVVVVLDPDGKISELDDGNNSLTSDAIAVSAAYTATVSVAEKVYLPGDEIVFSGSAVMPDGTTPAANLPVDVYVYVDGMRRSTNLTTNVSGDFSMVFKPTANEAGRYTIGACYPGLATSVTQDYFDILGMRLGNTSAIKCQISFDDIATRTVTIKNRSKTELTGLNATLSGVLEDVWDLSTSLPDTLPADGSITFRITAHAIGISPVTGEWDVVPVEITSNEGISLSFNVYLYSQAQKAQLALTPSSTTSKMTVGVQRLVELTVVNNGKGDSGKITVAVPPANWLRLVSQPTIDNLKNGETATITLEIYPKDEHNLVLNKPLSGVMGVSCVNGTGANATLNFTPVSDATGSIKVDVWDNAYYNQPDGSHPHLAGANVRVSNRYDNDRTVATGVTDESGIWTAGEIPVGEYQLVISAAMHDSFATNVVINPGQVTVVDKFIKYNLVTQTWDVRRTEVEDQYEVTMMLDFDTSVPSSKVEISLPDELPVLNEGESWTFVVHAVNSGLIQAENVTVTLPEIPGYTFTMSENGFTLPAKSSRDISVVMKRDRYAARTSGDLKMQLVLPGAYDEGDTIAATIVYKNTGSTAMPAPIFTLSSEGQEFTTDYATYTDAVRLIGLGSEDAPGTLEPGVEHEVEVAVKVNSKSQGFDLVVNHAGQESAQKPLDLRDFYDEDWVLFHAAEDDSLLSAISNVLGVTVYDYFLNLSTWINDRNSYVSDYLIIKESVGQYAFATATLDSSSEGQSMSIAKLSASTLSERNTCTQNHQVTGVNWSEECDGSIWKWCPSHKLWSLAVKGDAVYEPLDSAKETYIICHGNQNNIQWDWVKDMAQALYSKTGGNILAVSWGNGANGLIDGIPNVSAKYIAPTVEEAIRELKALQMSVSETTLIGHSHGGHVAANIAVYYDKIQFKRFVGLDVSTTDNFIHYLNKMEPDVWIGAINTCVRQTEFYKSTFDLSLEKTSELYGRWNFALFQANDFFEYKYTGFIGEHVVNVDEVKRHNYSHQWFISTIRDETTYANLGFNFDQEDSWYELCGKIADVDPAGVGGLCGVIRNDRVELLSKIRNSRVPWNYQLSGAKDLSELHRLATLTTDFAVDPTGLPSVLRDGMDIDITTANNADNLTIPYKMILAELGEYSLGGELRSKCVVSVWLVDLDNLLGAGASWSGTLDELNEQHPNWRNYCDLIGTTGGGAKFPLPGESANNTVRLSIDEERYGDNYSGRKFLMIAAYGDRNVQPGQPAFDLWATDNYALKPVSLESTFVKAIIEEGEGTPPVVNLASKAAAAQKASHNFLRGEGASGNNTTLVSVIAEADGTWDVVLNGWKSYAVGSELTIYQFSLPDASEKVGSIAFNAGDDFQINSAVAGLHGILPDGIDGEEYTVSLRVGTLDNNFGETSCKIRVTRARGGSGPGIGGGGDSGSPISDNVCWRRVLTMWEDPCGENHPVYKYEKYLKHGECPGSQGLIDKIRDDWHDTQTGGGYIGGPSTGSSGGGGASGGFSGGGGGFTVSVDDCAKGSSGGNAGLTPCQKALVDCGISVAANFIPGSEYVMAFKDGWDCGNNISEAWGANGNNYDKFDAVLNCGFTVAGFIPGVGWWSTGASCLYNTVKECGFKYTEKKEAGTLPKQLLGALLRDGEEDDDDAIVQTDFEKATVLYVTEINASCNWLIELFGSSDWCNLSAEQIKQFLTCARSTLDSNYQLSATALRSYCPASISDEALGRFVSRWNATAQAQTSGTALEDTDDDAGATEYIRFEKLIAYSDTMKECREEAIAAGYETAYAYFKEKIDEEAAIIAANQQAVCASVTLKLSQTISMTREAFEGTLTMYNGHSSVPITNLKLNLSIRNEDGDDKTGLFNKSDLGNDGSMTGGYILDGGLSVAPNSSGSATIQFIPWREAAKDGPQAYSFGGTISYVDPFSGKEQVVKLIDVTLTVNPSPYLHLDYFIQRDIYGDDPFTDDTVEASMPAEMAVLVHNTELGEARNVTIASVQPSVFLNEKGFAAEFRMTDFSLGPTALNGSTAHLGLNTVALGNIPGGESRVAQWWLTSSVDGHFRNMSATVAPLNKWNTPESSLVDLDHVGMHKLIRSLEVEGSELPWFLTSEIDDLYGAADSVYSPDGEKHDVATSATVASSGTLIGANPSLTVTVSPRENGWNYIYVAKEGLARYTVESVMRDDGVAVPVRNVWITSKVFRDGVMPMFEERLHIADSYEIADETVYTVVLSAKPTDVPEVAGFSTPDGAIEYVARNAVTVEFSKAIDPDTFTTDAITLRKQGVVVDDLSGLAILPADDTGTRFSISGLAALCSDNARYELVVQCVGIADLSGQLGVDGRAVSWTLALPDSPYIFGIEGTPTRRVKRLDGVTAVMSISVTDESASNLHITLNGTDVSEFLTVSPLDASGTRYAIEGLEDLQLTDGDYELVIYGDNLVSLDGGLGMDSRTIHWTRDTVAPVLNTLRREESGMNGAAFVLEMSETADPSTISLDNMMLTRKTSATLNSIKRGLLGSAPAGETEIPLSADRVRFVSQGDGTYLVTGIDSLIDVDGTYTLYFDASGVTDEAGNESTGTRSVTWTVDTTSPEEVSDIAVSSEYGTIDACVYSTTRELTISGTVPEAGLVVEVLARAVGGNETLLAEPEVDDDLRFTANVVLPNDGGTTIVVRLTDAAGLSSETAFDVFVDAVALDADITGMPKPDEAAGDFVVTFNAAPDETTALAATMTLTRDGATVSIPNVTIFKTDDRVYTISGLAEYTVPYGTYVFTYDVRDVRKAISGMTGDAVATATWVNYQTDTTAPTIADIRFDGVAPEAAYVTDQMFSEVSVRFSEAVNVPDLVSRGVAGQAFSIQLLSDDNAVVGTLPAEDIAWNASTFTASWTIDGSAVPCGRARLVVDPSLIKDTSGNGLATTEAYDVISGAKTYTPSLLKSGVAYSYACPALYDWNNDGLLDLVVGEKTEDAKGKVRIYLNRGTANAPAFDDYTYLKKDGADVEFTAQGCVGMQVSFGRLRRATMVLASSQGEIFGWRHRARDAKTKGNVEWESWFAHDTDARFSSLIRTQTFCCDMDGDGYDEVIVSGQNSPMFWIKRTMDGEEYVSECTPLMDALGANLQFPEGQNHTAAIMTDVSGDAVLDLVTGDTAGNVWVYYGTGNARFSATPLMIYENTETANKRSRLTVGDIDGDGVEDILVGRQDGSVLLLKGEAVLSPAVNFKCVEIKSVEEALNDYIYWENGADGWTCEQFGEEAQATVTHTGDEQTTVLTAKFTGVGTVSFTWAVTGSNESSEFRCTGGDPELVKAGPFSQIAQSVTLSTPGEHLVSWVFRGRNTAIVRDVAFAPADESLQVTQTTAVPIPFSDINRLANDIWKAQGGDYEAAANATAANGKSVMENCIAGVDSSDPDASFTAKITYEDGKAKISWIPALNGEVENEGVPTGIRTYTVYGTDNLETPNWQIVTPENKPSMRFFKVQVQMP